MVVVEEAVVEEVVVEEEVVATTSMMTGHRVSVINPLGAKMILATILETTEREMVSGAAWAMEMENNNKIVGTVVVSVVAAIMRTDSTNLNQIAKDWKEIDDSMRKVNSWKWK